MAPGDSSSSDLLFKAGTRAQLSAGREWFWHRTDTLQVSLFTDLHLSPCNSWLQLQHTPPAILSPASQEPSYPENAILMSSAVHWVRTCLESVETPPVPLPAFTRQSHSCKGSGKHREGKSWQSPKIRRSDIFYSFRREAESCRKQQQAGLLFQSPSHLSVFS